MTRIVFLLTPILLLTSSLLHAQDYNYRSVGKAIKNPADIEYVAVDLTDARMAEFYDVSTGMINLKAVRVEAWRNPTQLTILCNYLSKVPNLELLDLPLTNLYMVPREVSKLQSLQTLQVRAALVEEPSSAFLIDRVAEGGNDFKIEVYDIKNTPSTELDHLVQLFPGTLVQPLSVRKPVDFTFMPVGEMVSPPLAGIDVEQDEYSLEASLGSKIYHASGTVIEVPENAFVDADGNEVKGQITMTYRELSDPVSMLASGVPMTYDSAGQQGFLESAGMFEMRAFDESGNELKLREGKQIDIELVTSSNQTNYNYYTLDEETGKWVYRNSDVNVVSQDVARPLSSAWAIFTFYKKDLMESTFDDASFEERWADDSYSFLYKKGQDNAEQIRNDRYAAGKRYVEWWTAPKLTLESCKIEADGHKTEVYEIHANHRSWPELRAWRNVKWMPFDLEGNEEFKAVISDEVIHDLRIVCEEENNAYFMVVKTARGKVEMEVLPVIEDEEDAHDLVTKAYADYTSYLEKKAANFNKELTRRQWKYEKDVNRAMKVVRYHMSQEEKKMTHETWLAYVRYMAINFAYAWDNSARSPEEILDRLEMSERTSRRNSRRMQRSRRSFSISGNLGFCNVDIFVQPFRAPQPGEMIATANDLKDEDAPVTIRASFVNSKGMPMNVARVYVFEEGYNGVLHFAVPDGEAETNILFNPSYKTTMVAVDRYGQLSILRPRAVGRLKVDPIIAINNKLEMQPLKASFTDVESLKKAIRL